MSTNLKVQDNCHVQYGKEGRKDKKKGKIESGNRKKVSSEKMPKRIKERHKGKERIKRREQ